MKGEVGMLWHEKERQQEVAYTKTEIIHNPIPTSLLISLSYIRQRKDLHII